MKRTFEVTLTRGTQSAAYLLHYPENERPETEIPRGDYKHFTRRDGSRISFKDVHMDKLASTVQEWASEIGAEGEIAEATG
ncbi:MAG: hypothetical protein V4819_03900 [Verrucomicrobiota bacterium]